ncbi:MAG: antibiotic biosynthesis monooxygenase [Bacteroidia bacterium]|nr:antibiotic biosynthesis monooxygenase [Bacteroidia bacterium]
MIIRIVKMTFMPEKVTEFLSVFDASKQLIRNMPGCTHLELLNDINSPSIFFTYSYWNSENDLNKYRDSDLFKTVWSQTKILFDAKPEAWSVEQKVKL